MPDSHIHNLFIYLSKALPFRWGFGYDGADGGDADGGDGVHCSYACLDPEHVNHYGGHVDPDRGDPDPARIPDYRN